MHGRPERQGILHQSQGRYAAREKDMALVPQQYEKDHNDAELLRASGRARLLTDRMKHPPVGEME